MPRTQTLPLSAAVLFSSLSVSDFFESKEKGVFPQFSSPGFGA